MKLMHILACDLPFLAMDISWRLAQAPYSCEDKAEKFSLFREVNMRGCRLGSLSPSIMCVLERILSSIGGGRRERRKATMPIKGLAPTPQTI